MKTIYYSALLIFLVSLSSCDKGFEKLNENPNAYVDPDINQLFSNAIVTSDGGPYEIHRANLIYCGNMMQHFASFGYPGDKYTYSSEYSGAFFDRMYPNAVKELSQMLLRISEDAQNVNYRSATRIMKVYAMHRITDLYGDVPYFDAGKGYTDGIYAPAYDKQQDIYADMLTELEQSAIAFDGSKPTFGEADLLFGGDILKWKKFSYSLMLRLGMRLTKVDAAMAEQYVKKAIAGGVFTSEDGLGAVLQHSDATVTERNPNSVPLINEDLQNGERPNNKLSATLINQLKQENDPRLRIIAKLESTGDNIPADQQGLPNGSDATSVPGSLTAFSNLNTSTINRYQTPSLLISTAEVNFLLAEAALRGWATDAAASYYEKAIASSMDVFSTYTTGSAVAPVNATETAAYISSHALQTGGSTDQQMEQIHTELWVALLMNEIEAFANWRRTGYPVLIPVNYPGNVTGGIIPRRLQYSDNEIGSNNANYNAAVARQGADDLVTRVWWDKP